MADQEEKLEKLHGFISSKYDSFPDVETFSKAMQDESKRKKMYDFLSGKYDNFPEYDKFSKIVVKEPTFLQKAGKFLKKELQLPAYSLAAGFAESGSQLYKELDNLSIWLSEKTGLERGGIFEDLHKSAKEEAEFLRSKGIPQESIPGKVLSNIVEGAGRAVGDIPQFIAGGLAPVSAIKGAARTAEEKGEITSGAIQGLTEGLLLGVALKGAALLPTVAKPAAGATIFGVPSIIETLKLPEEERDWPKAISEVFVGAGLMVPSMAKPGKTIVELKRDFLDSIENSKIPETDAKSKDFVDKFNKAMEGADIKRAKKEFMDLYGIDIDSVSKRISKMDQVLSKEGKDVTERANAIEDAIQNGTILSKKEFEVFRQQEKIRQAPGFAPEVKADMEALKEQLREKGYENESGRISKASKIIEDLEQISTEIKSQDVKNISEKIKLLKKEVRALKPGKDFEILKREPKALGSGKDFEIATEKEKNRLSRANEIISDLEEIAKEIKAKDKKAREEARPKVTKRKRFQITEEMLSSEMERLETELGKEKMKALPPGDLRQRAINNLKAKAELSQPAKFEVEPRVEVKTKLLGGHKKIVKEPVAKEIKRNQPTPEKVKVKDAGVIQKLDKLAKDVPEGTIKNNIRKIQNETVKSKQRPYVALKLKDGTIIKDRNAGNHGDLINRQNIDPDNVADTGWWINNKYMSYYEQGKEKAKKEVISKKPKGFADLKNTGQAKEFGKTTKLTEEDFHKEYANVQAEKDKFHNKIPDEKNPDKKDDLIQKVADLGFRKQMIRESLDAKTGERFIEIEGRLQRKPLKVKEEKPVKEKVKKQKVSLPLVKPKKEKVVKEEVKKPKAKKAKEQKGVTVKGEVKSIKETLEPGEKASKTKYDKNQTFVHPQLGTIEVLEGKGEIIRVRFEDGKEALVSKSIMDSQRAAEDITSKAEKATGKKVTKYGEDVIDRINKETKKEIEAEQEKHPKTSGIGSFITGKKATDPSYTFSNPDIEAQHRANHGVKKPSIGERIFDRLQSLKDKFTRGAFEYLPRGKYSGLRNELLRILKEKNIQSDEAIKIIDNITRKLDKETYNLFDRMVLLDDLMYEVSEGRNLPNKWTPDEVVREWDRLNTLINSSDPIIRKYLDDRKAIWGQIKNDTIFAAKEIGIDLSEAFKNPNYFRHQVLDFSEYTRLRGTGDKLKTPRGRSHLKKRGGTERNINTNYLEAEFSVMSQMLYDIKIMESIKYVDDNFNIIDILRHEAKVARRGELGGAKGDPNAVWQDFIPEDYTVWRPDQTNLLFPVHAIPESLAGKLMRGILEEAKINETDIKQVLAFGGKRNGFVIPKEVASQLNNLVESKDLSPLSQISRKTLRGFKAWTLNAPRRLIKYNIRNVSGDADAVFVGNPSAFKKVREATKELYGFFFQNKPLTGNIKEFANRGAFHSTFQAQELHQLGSLKQFQEKVSKFGAREDNVFKKNWNKYWNATRKISDYRESILRYANFLEYIEQLGSPGGLKNYGASIKSEVDALPNIYDKAYKLQNELLGAYDDISVVGQELRAKHFPFWSWKEANMKRYYRLMKNAGNDGRLAASIGRKILGTTIRSPLLAAKVGKFAVMSTAMWTMMQVWNRQFFPEEEEALPLHIKRTPHLIFGRDPKTNEVIYFNRLGALGDFLEWFGLDKSPYLVEDFLEGKKDLPTVLKDIAKSPLNAIAQGLRPEYKVPFEIVSGKTAFPDVFQPRPVRNKYRQFWRNFGLENEFDAVTNMPTMGYVHSIKSSVLYFSDDDLAAYTDIYTNKELFKKNKGEYYDFNGAFSPRSNAIYNYKLGLKYGDKDAAKAALIEYVNYGGTKKSLDASLRALDPLYGLNKKDEKEFINNFLNDEDKKKLRKAQKFYKEVLLKDSKEMVKEVKDEFKKVRKAKK